MAVQRQKRGFGKTRTPKAVVLAAAAARPARGLSTYRVGKIATEAGQALCIVRMISPCAIALDIEVPFAGADQASLAIGKEVVSGALILIGGRRSARRRRAAAPCPGSRWMPASGSR